MNEYSRTEAHKVFADLYRKKRTPDHQQIIDEVIQKSNDVFIRIDLIKKADEDYWAKQVEVKDSENGKASREERYKILDEELKKGKETKPKTPAKLVSTNTLKKKPEPKKTGGGLLAGLFGGANSEISQFAKESGAIELGFLGRNPQVSLGVDRLFKGLREDQIIATLQAIKMAETQGWRYWTPQIYNIVTNFGRFFQSFISLETLFIERPNPEVFLDRSMKMQIFYMRILDIADTKDIVTQNLTKLIKLDDKLFARQGSIISAITYVLSLELSRPRLSDVIRAFYIVAKKKMYSIEDVKLELNPPPLMTDRFAASPEIKREVDIAISKTTDELNTRSYKLEELQNLKARYFKMDQSGKISFDFINQIIEEYFKRYMIETNQTQTIKSSFKSMPQKLLYLAMRDLQTNFSTMLEGTIKVTESAQEKDVIIIQPGLFKQEIENFNNLLRSLDSFNRKYLSFVYSFSNFNSDFGKPTQDQIIKGLLEMIVDCARAMGTLATDINIIIENHLLAVEAEKNGRNVESLHANKDKVIEEIKIHQKYIPFHDLRIVSKDRVNGMTVFEAFNELARCLYNYAILFKDKATTQKLTLGRKFSEDMDRLKEEYGRLTGKEYVFTKRNKALEVPEAESKYDKLRKKESAAEPEPELVPESKDDMEAEL